MSTHFLGQRCVCTGSTCNGIDVQHGQRQVLRRREACTSKHECMYACAHTQTACMYTQMHSPRRPTLLLPTLSVGQRTCTTWLDQEPSGPGMVKKSLFSGNGRRTTNSNAGDPASVLASTIPASKWGPWNFSRSHPFQRLLLLKAVLRTVFFELQVNISFAHIEFFALEATQSCKTRVRHGESRRCTAGAARPGAVWALLRAAIGHFPTG